MSTQIRQDQSIAIGEACSDWSPKLVMHGKWMKQDYWKTHAHRFIVELDIIASDLHKRLAEEEAFGAIYLIAATLTKESPQQESSCSHQRREYERCLCFPNHRIGLNALYNQCFRFALFGKFISKCHLQDFGEV